jgi:hypothetical protein
MYKEYDLQVKNEPNIFSVSLFINLTTYAQV